MKVSKSLITIHDYNNDGLNPLLLACRYGNFELMKYLHHKKDLSLTIENNLNPYAKNWSILHWSILSNDKKVILWVMEQYRAINNITLERIIELYEEIDPITGYNILHLAIIHGKSISVTTLLELNVNPIIKTDNNTTPPNQTIIDSSLLLSEDKPLPLISITSLQLFYPTSTDIISLQKQCKEAYITVYKVNGDVDEID